jgi:pimeloyl-ACP methyl ester carboxylesterase
MRQSLRQGSSEYLKLLGLRRYHYLAWPRISSTRLVLLHGRGECADIWTAFAGRLASSADILAVDLRGHGGTPWDPDAHYELDDFVDDLCLQIRHWNRPSVLIGHGLGAQIAMRGTQKLGDLVKAVVVIDPEDGDGETDTLIEILAAAAVSGGATNSRMYGDALWEKLYRDMTWAQPSRGRTAKCDPAVLDRLPAMSQSGRVSSLSQTALVIASGYSGHRATALSGDLKETLPYGRIVNVPSGAWPHVRSPAETAEVVLRFVRGLAQ